MLRGLPRRCAPSWTPQGTACWFTLRILRSILSTDHPDAPEGNLLPDGQGHAFHVGCGTGPNIRQGHRSLSSSDCCGSWDWAGEQWPARSVTQSQLRGRGTDDGRRQKALPHTAMRLRGRGEEDLCLQARRTRLCLSPRQRARRVEVLFTAEGMACKGTLVLALYH